jgi:hypothetical protein
MNANTRICATPQAEKVLETELPLLEPRLNPNSRVAKSIISPSG